MALRVVKMLKVLRFKSMPRMHLILKMLGICNIGIAPLFKACASQHFRFNHNITISTPIISKRNKSQHFSPSP